MFTTIQSRTFLSSRLLSKNLKIRLHSSAGLSLVVYGCENLVSDFKDGTYILRVFDEDRTKEGWSDGRLEKTAGGGAS
jgi:hypothetical protein